MNLPALKDGASHLGSPLDELLAELAGVNFSRANLSDADLVGANLSGSKGGAYSRFGVIGSGPT